MAGRRRKTVFGAATPAIVLSGCEQQEARPLALTLPVAALLATVFVAALATEVGWILRRLPSHAVRRGSWPWRLVVVAPLLAATAVAILVWSAVVWESAVGYRRPRFDVVGWSDLVVLATVLGVLVLAAIGLLLPLGWAAWHLRTWGLATLALVALGALAGQIVLCLTTPGIEVGEAIAALEVGYLLLLAALWTTGRPSAGVDAEVDPVAVA